MHIKFYNLVLIFILFLIPILGSIGVVKAAEGDYCSWAYYQKPWRCVRSGDRCVLEYVRTGVPCYITNGACRAHIYVPITLWQPAVHCATTYPNPVTGCVSVPEQWDYWTQCVQSCQCTPSSCSPTCPSGQVNYDTGYGVASTQSCSYQTGSCNGDGSCSTATNTRTCWYSSTPPSAPIINPISSVSSSTSPLGCTTSNIGMETNNEVRISGTFTDSNGVSDLRSIQVWLTPGAAPVITNIYDTGTPDLLSNNSFGFLIREVGGVWSDLYVPGVSGTSSSYTWVKVGTIGSGERGRIKGSSNSDLAILSDISVNEVGSNAVLSADIQFISELSGIATYEKATDGTYKVYASANDNAGFLPSGGNTIVNPNTWTDSGRTMYIDLNRPVVDDASYSFNASENLEFNWTYSDSFSPVIKSIGDASVGTPGSSNDVLDDLTSGVSDYVLGSGATGSNVYSGYHLWSVNNDSSRIEEIDLNGNSGGSLMFRLYGFDSACNSISTDVSVGLGSAWITTKGGIVNSGSGSNIDVRTLTGHETFSADTYWNSPFSFLKDESDLTSELLTGSGSTLNSLLYSSRLRNVTLSVDEDVNNKPNYWYTELLRRVNMKISATPDNFANIDLIGNQTLSGSSTNISGCVNSKNCVVKVAGTLVINSNFVCDARTAFFVTGNVRIEPDITAPNQSYGCMFIARGRVTISDGTYKSSGSTYPKYDIVEAFMVSDDIIFIQYVDDTRTVRDGLKINGSILGFGISSNGRSVVFARSLGLLQNNLYPALAVHFDNRYLNFAPIFFGGQIDGFEREIGFKPL